MLLMLPKLEFKRLRHISTRSNESLAHLMEPSGGWNENSTRRKHISRKERVA